MPPLCASAGMQIPMDGAVAGGSGLRSKSTSDFWYDVAGWGIMIASVFGVLALARNSQPVAPGALAPK